MPRLSSAEDLGAGLLPPARATNEGVLLADGVEDRVGTPRQRRLYEEWPGHNRFCCRGHIMIGPWEDWPYNLCAWSSILVPSVSYLYLAVPLIYEKTDSVWLPLFSMLMLGSTVLCLCLTSCSDPGYLPRQPQPGPLEGHGRQRRIQTALGAQLFTWCQTCKLWRPPKSHHCSSCGHCVLG